MSKNYKKIINTLLAIIFIGWAIYYFNNNKEYLQLLIKLNPLCITIICMLNLISLYQNGLFLKIITQSFNIKLKEHFEIATSTSFYNLILPLRGGSAIRAIYMKKIHGQKYSHFISSLIGNYVIILLVGSTIALITFTNLYLSKNIFNLPISLIFISIFTLTLYLSIGAKIPKFHNRFLNKINLVSEGWQQITKHPKVIPKLILNTTISFLIESLKIKLIFLALGHNLSLFESLYFATVSTLSSFINITPGSLGINEALFMISSTVLHIPPQLGLLVAIINRILNTVILLILGPICNFRLQRHYTKKTQ